MNTFGTSHSTGAERLLDYILKQISDLHQELLIPGRPLAPLDNVVEYDLIDPEFDA
jgi:hypothetical protein